MGTPRLSDGLWVPQLQMVDAGDIGNTQVSFPAAIATSKDLLKNDSHMPMIVRSFSCTYNWVTERYDASGTLLYDVSINTRRRGAYKLSVNGSPYVPPANFVTGLYGSAAVAAKPYVFKLASPCRLGPGEVILIEVGNVESEEVFVFTATTGTKTTAYMIHCRDVVTGEHIFFSNKGTFTVGQTSKVTGAHQNPHDTPLDILSITVYTGSATTDRPLLSVEVAGRRWSRGERPMWLYCEPFKHDRLDLSRLPEGGLYLEPGDGLSVDLFNSQYENTDNAGTNVNIYLVLGMEAYLKVA